MREKELAATQKKIALKILLSMTVEQKRDYFENQQTKAENDVGNELCIKKIIKIKSKIRGDKWEEIFKPRCPYKENNIKNKLR